MTSQPAEWRLITAIQTLMNKQPSSFPHRADYDPTSATPDEVYGWNLINDHRFPGDVAILPSAMRKLSQQAGVNSLRAALRQLANHEILIRGNELDGVLTRRIQIGHGKQNRSLPRVYLLKLPAELPASEPDTSPHLDEYVDLHEGLNQAATELGVPASQVIHQALAQWLSAHGYHLSKSPTADN